MEPNVMQGTFEIRAAKNEEELDDLLSQGFEVVISMPDERYKLRKKKEK
jgi:hypothetical protein